MNSQTQRRIKLYRIGLVILIIIIALIWLLWWGADSSKLEDVTVEFHGLFFDYLMIGLIYLLYDSRKEAADKAEKEEEKIERWKEELEDFRHWEADESAVRILGILRRLEKAGAKAIDIDNCSFKGRTIHEMIFPDITTGSASFEDTILKKVHIKNANLDGAHFMSAHLSVCSFKGSNFSSSSFSFAELVSVDFTKTIWRNSGFEKATLEQVDFTRADLEGVDFTGADLIEVNFTDVENLFVSQLLKANRLISPIGLPPTFIKQIADTYPKLLRKEGRGIGREDYLTFI
jgi:uncharacterized protein YjbI with pentapeptide repeats